MYMYVYRSMVARARVREIFLSPSRDTWRIHITCVTRKLRAVVKISSAPAKLRFHRRKSVSEGYCLANTPRPAARSDDPRFPGERFFFYTPFPNERKITRARQLDLSGAVLIGPSLFSLFSSGDDCCLCGSTPVSLPLPSPSSPLFYPFLYSEVAAFMLSTLCTITTASLSLAVGLKFLTVVGSFYSALRSGVSISEGLARIASRLYASVGLYGKCISLTCSTIPFSSQLAVA